MEVCRSFTPKTKIGAWQKSMNDLKFDDMESTAYSFQIWKFECGNFDCINLLVWIQTLLFEPYFSNPLFNNN